MNTVGFQPSRRELAILFGVLAVFYSACPVLAVYDSAWVIPTAISIIREGNINLDEYAPSFASFSHGIHQQKGHFYSFFPLGPALVALPVVALFEGVFRVLEVVRPGSGLTGVGGYWRRHFDATGEINPLFWARGDQVISSLVSALVVVAFFALAARFLSRRRALAISVVFALCTPVLSTMSRAMWQHGPSALFLVLTLFCLVRARDGARWTGLAGLFLALAFTMRPTNAIPVLVLTAYVFFSHRSHFVRFVAAAAVVAVPWMGLNLFLLGTPLPLYYQPWRLSAGLSGSFAEALVGNLVSPARGLLIFVPVLLLVPLGISMKRRAGEFTRLDSALLVIVVAHWLGISAFPHWWGGHSYGPRFFADMLPFMAYFLIPVVKRLRWGDTLRERGLVAGFALLSLTGFVIHVRGAVDRGGYGWNFGPPDVDQAPERVWDWKDPQFWPTKAHAPPRPR